MTARTPEDTPEILHICKAARTASRIIARAPSDVKNHALAAMAEQLTENKPHLLAENAKDLKAASAKGLSDALADRLELNDDRIAGMVDGIEQVIALPDLVGEIDGAEPRPSGIFVGKMRVPLGVIGIIYESRPNVTADTAALCLKAGNAVILRGGSEAIHSNIAIAECIDEALAQAGLPSACVQLIRQTGREMVGEILKMDAYIDVLIPRGGKGLIERVSAETKIPVLKHLDGVCHVYVDDSADTEMALDIATNSKTHRYGVCNAMESLLVSQEKADEFLPQFAQRMREHDVELRGCPVTCRLIEDATPAQESDWSEEYLAPILAVRVVPGLDDAIEHIGQYGSHHTDTIVTENEQHAERFMREVDSSSVMHNASTRFADGYEYGLGAEIGISTNKLHARGPVGLEGLTTYKFVVFGKGQIRK